MKNDRLIEVCNSYVMDLRMAIEAIQVKSIVAQEPSSIADVCATNTYKAKIDYIQSVINDATYIDVH